MRLLVGGLLLFLIFEWSSKMSGIGLVGFVNAEAFVLVALSPLAVVLIIFEWREIGTYFGILVRAFRYSENRARKNLSDHYQAVHQALQQGNPFEAIRLIEGSCDEVVRSSGLLFLKHYEREKFKEVFGSKAQQTLGVIKRGEDFFKVMARAAPAFGLIGTIKGFISLLNHLKDSENLGLGMAVALASTLYGITMSYCIYDPLSKSMGTYAKKLTQDFRLAEQAMLLIQDGRSSQDLELLFGKIPSEATSETGEKAA